MRPSFANLKMSVKEDRRLREVHTSENPSGEEIRAELDRLLQSSIFLQSDRLGRFLRFAIENTLSGNTDVLKEYVIGTEVYDRKPPYHPSQDSIVRTEARRLRAKLKEYYESEGRQNPVFIYFRPGTYVPLFRRNDASGAPVPNGPAPESDLLIRGTGTPIAVLPLVDLSGQPLSSRCARAVTDDLIHHLTHTDGIRVIARSSNPQVIDSAFDIPSLCQKFGLAAVIDGTVREEGARLRIVIRALGSDGFQLSSHRFETMADADILTQVQEQVATAFVSRARPALSQVRRRKAAPGDLVFAVYPLTVHAETLLDEGSSTDLPAALLKLQEATEVAPSYGRSYCGISQCHTELALRGARPSSTAVAAAKQAASRAIELDPEMTDSHSCLGAAQALDWDWEGARKSFLHSMKLGTEASTSRRYALFLSALGQHDEAEHHLAIAEQIDPFSNRQKIGRARFLHMARRFEDGVRMVSKPLIYGPLPVEALLLGALMSAHAGNTEKALDLAQRLRSSAAGQLFLMAGIAEVFARSGEATEANRIVDAFKLLAPETPISRYRQALIALALHDHQQALSLLKISADESEAELVWIGGETAMDPLRDMGSFREIVGKVLPSQS
jgi:TolB-like protein/tetratricopeptide (TPR) repeat protein